MTITAANNSLLLGDSEKVTMFTENVIKSWVEHDRVTVCPSHYGLNDHCDENNCVDCKLIALQEAGVVQTG